MESMKIINPKVQAVAHEQSKDTTKRLRVYKFHKTPHCFCVTALDSISYCTQVTYLIHGYKLLKSGWFFTQ